MEEAGATQNAANREEQKTIPTLTAQAAERSKDGDSGSKEDILRRRKRERKCTTNPVASGRREHAALGRLGHVDGKRKREARQAAAWAVRGFSRVTGITVDTSRRCKPHD